MSQIAQLRKMFEETLPMFESHFRFKADYSVESLDSLEGILDVMYPKGAMARDTTLIMAGYYVGEVFIRNISGSRWDEDLAKGNPYCVTFDMPGDTKLMVCPPEMVRDYIAHPVNSISRLFRYYKEVAAGKRDIDDTLAGTGYTEYGQGR